MLEDTQLEVRLGASTTLSGMIRCSPAALRSKVVQVFNKKFSKMLLSSPLPKKARNAVSEPSTGTSTPTPEQSKLVLTRHASVLGLGALVQAFPYTSPPPSWIPGILTTLANKANNDPGMVGKSVKSILSDFKKTRQDTWQMDLKVSSYTFPAINRSENLLKTCCRHFPKIKRKIWTGCCGRATLHRWVIHERLGIWCRLMV